MPDKANLTVSLYSGETNKPGTKSAEYTVELYAQKKSNPHKDCFFSAYFICYL